MRIYLHYEEEEPNHTAALTCDSTEITFGQLLRQFVDIYNDRFGEDYALDADSLELRSSKKKKLPLKSVAAGSVVDRDDIFVTPSTSKQPRKTAPRPGKPAPSPARPPGAATTPPAAAAPNNVAAPPPPPPVTRQSVVEANSEPEEKEHEVEAEEEEEEESKSSRWTDAAEGVSELHIDPRHKFAMERPAVSFEEDEQMERASPVPTHEHNVQSNCIKCQQHMFYKAQNHLVTCCHCSYLHAAVECSSCGTYFPTTHDQDMLSCPACRHKAPLTSFQERQRKSQSKAEERLPVAAEPNEIHLIVQYYKDKSEVRQKEVDACLRRNIECEHIRHVHILTEEPMDLNHFQKGDKLVQYVQGSWLSYRDAILYAHRFLPGKVVIIANADIHMDSSLGLVRDMDLSGRCLALTRHDVVNGGKARSFNAGAAPISQDAWVFKAPLPEGVLPNVEFLFGKPGCDNRMAYELRRVGIRVTNPCFRVIANHLHESDLRNYVHGRDTVHGAYAAVLPIHSLT